MILKRKSRFFLDCGKIHALGQARDRHKHIADYAAQMIMMGASQLEPRRRALNPDPVQPTRRDKPFNGAKDRREIGAKVVTCEVGLDLLQRRGVTSLLRQKSKNRGSNARGSRHGAT